MTRSLLDLQSLGFLTGVAVGVLYMHYLVEIGEKNALTDALFGKDTR